MLKILKIAMLTAIVVSVQPGRTIAQTSPGANAFDFAVMGDMPYKLPDDYPKVDRLIGAINKMKPAFTLHVGDIKSGSSPCTDEVFKRAFEQLQTVEGPLVYTIGDNE